MKVIIPAAGDGTRMGKLGKTPKGLMKIGNESVLERTIRICRSMGVKDFVFVLGYKSPLIERHLQKVGIGSNISIVHNRHWEWTSSLYSVWLTRYHMLNTDSLIINSDVVFNEKALSIIMANNSNYVVSTRGPVSNVEECDVKIYHNPQNNRIKYIGKGVFEKDVDKLDIYEDTLVIKIRRNFVPAFIEYARHVLLEKDLALSRFDTENYMAERGELLTIVNTGINCIEFDTPEEYKKIVKRFSK